jgi:hypothetical protein
MITSTSMTSLKRFQYESLLDEEDLRRHNRKNFSKRFAWAAVVVLALVGVVALRNSNKQGGQKKGEHTIPTLLSVVHHETGKYVWALENPLYEKLKHARVIYHDEAMSRTATDYKTRIMESPTLQVDRTKIKLRDPVTLSWTMGKDHRGESVLADNDVIMLHCGDQVYETDLNQKQFLDAATISQARATSLKHSADVGRKYQEQQWHFPAFPVLRQDVCQFSLLQLVPGDESDTYALLDTSSVIQIEASRTTPTSIHLALGNSPSEMVVQFITGYEKGQPVARYSRQGSKKSEFNKATGTSHTYTANDLCEAPANITEAGKFQPPGIMHVIRLTGLEPNTEYQYQVGLSHGQGITWSESFSFTSAPLVGDTAPHSLIVYGDQGCSSEGCDGWGPGGEATIGLTTREVDNPKDGLPIRSIHHFGDLSYAKGAGHVWDMWMELVSSFTTKVPLMVAIGNHEYDHLSGGDNGRDPSGVSTADGYRPLWGNFHNDSNG